MLSLKKSRNILKWGYAWYKKKGNTLSPERLTRIEQILEELDEAIRNDNREKADGLAKQLEEFTHTHLKKSKLEYALEIGVALIFALIVATVVRQTWFELYEIPSGSMRPTFKEQDRLTVSKTAFGINIPLTTGHFIFDPDLVKRTGVVIWTGENIPGADEDTTYFKIFPYKKRYIKRLMGKPGDSLYFYGGKVYGVDEDGNSLREYLDAPWMENLEFLPFMYLEGTVKAPNRKEITFNLMNQQIGKVQFTPIGPSAGEVFNGEDWIKDNPLALKGPHDQIETYSDIWGIGNFAMAKLLTKEELGTRTTSLGNGVLYLELIHTPRLALPTPQFTQGRFGLLTSLPTSTTIIPLQQHHVDALMKNMYTSRINISKGKRRGYPLFQGIPDGTYEFYFGEGVKLGWGGITHTLPKNFPLMSHSPSNVQALFNLGTELHAFYEPNTFEQLIYPHRYAYFRDGDLYVMGGILMSKEDPTLQAFVKNENERANTSSDSNPYFPFIDLGPPLKEDGSFDVEKIRTFGLKIPEKEYLVLGDNHAISQDSRFFGFVPQDNLQGVPSLIIWPPGERWGPPAQVNYPIFTLPRIIVWGIVLLIIGVWYGYQWKTRHAKVYHKIDF